MNSSRQFGGRTAKENMSFSSVISQPEDADMKPIETPADIQNTPVTSETSIFSSPIDVVCTSLDDSKSECITVHDLVDAYSVMASALRAIVIQPRNAEVPSFDMGPIRNRLSLFVCAMRRDIKKVLYGPFNAEEISEDGLTARQIRRAKDASVLSHHALRVLSQLLSFACFQSIFKTKQLTSFFDDVLTILDTNSLPTPNASRTYGLLLWILQVQRLPPSVILSRKNKLLRVIDKTLEGAFGKDQFQYDGLKIVAIHLRRPEKELQLAFLGHFEKTLPYLTSDSPNDRLHAANVLSAFAFARIANHRDETFISLSHTLQRFLVKERTSFGSPLKDAFKQKHPTHFAEGPVWACVVLSSSLIILDRFIFVNETLIGPLAGLLTVGCRHERQAVSLLSHRIWHCLVWSFSRVERKAQNELLWTKALGFVQQAPQCGTGNALAFVLLGAHPPNDSGDMGCYVSDVLSTANEMLKFEHEDTQKDGEALLARLLDSVGNLSVPTSTTTNTSVILSRELFDGTLIDVSLKDLDKVIEAMKPVNFSYVRRLSEQEIVCHWDKLLELWTIIIRRALKHKEPQFPRLLTDMWQQLLLVKSQLSQGIGHLTATETVVDEAIDVVVGLIDTNTAVDRQPYQLLLIQRLWHTMTLAFNEESIAYASRVMLQSIVKHKFRLEKAFVMEAFLPLYEALRSNVQDWVIIARSLQDRHCDWDSLAAFTRTTTPEHIRETEHFAVWSCLVREARLSTHDESGKTITVQSLWRDLQAEALHERPVSYPQLVYPLFSALSLSYPSSEDQDLLRDIVKELYPPLAENMKISLGYLTIAEQIVSSIPIDRLVSFLLLCSDAFSFWLEDKARAVSDNDYNCVIMPLYSRIVERLETMEPEGEVITKLGALLSSPMGRCPPPGIAPTVFEAFWRATYHPRRAEFYAHYSDDLKTCLKDLDIAYNLGFAVDFSQTTNSQAQGEYVVPETIPSQVVAHQYTEDEFYMPVNIPVRQKQAQASQLMTPEPSRYSSTSPFRTKLLQQVEEEEDYGWDDGHVSVGDVREVRRESQIEHPQASSSDDNTPQRNHTMKNRSEPILNSPSMMGSSLRRSGTTSASLLDLQRIYKTFTEGKGDIPVEDLLQASRLVKSLGAAIDEQLDRQCGTG
uniref:Telomere-associated protein Rif1 N-terminal domain-containing protein n=1 Tax=Moniliophthora roreri TaxID=221103 RepID=A0A0W0G7N8_MONRR